jgi:hypothetical protein
VKSKGDKLQRIISGDYGSVIERQAWGLSNRLELSQWVMDERD